LLLKKGALVGLVVSTGVNLWLGVGGILWKQPIPRKPLSTAGCANDTTKTVAVDDLKIFKASGSQNLSIYDVSYFYYPLIAVIIVFVLGTLVSLIVDKAKLVEKREPHPLDHIQYTRNKKSKPNQVQPEKKLKEKTTSF
jgi:hypothetical protein